MATSETGNYTEEELDDPDFYPTRDPIEVRAAWEYLGELHCTLWSDFLIADSSGRLIAARWLGGLVNSVSNKADSIRSRRLYNGRTR
jgi:hypothetical protein